MEAVRCRECGETRWSLFPALRTRVPAAPCELCGGETVVERRRPGTHRGPLPVERRWAEPAGAGGVGAKSLHAR
jgi:hypothetical protein